MNQIANAASELGLSEKETKAIDLAREALRRAIHSARKVVERSTRDRRKLARKNRSRVATLIAKVLSMLDTNE